MHNDNFSIININSWKGVKRERKNNSFVGLFEDKKKREDLKNIFFLLKRDLKKSLYYQKMEKDMIFFLTKGYDFFLKAFYNFLKYYPNLFLKFLLIKRYKRFFEFPLIASLCPPFCFILLCHLFSSLSNSSMNSL